jgi:hypothetical protein
VVASVVRWAGEVCADEAKLMEAMSGLEGGRRRPAMGRCSRRQVKSTAACGFSLLGESYGERRLGEVALLAPVGVDLAMVGGELRVAQQR